MGDYDTSVCEHGRNIDSAGCDICFPPRCAQPASFCASRLATAIAERDEARRMLAELRWAGWCNMWPIVGRLLGDRDTAPLPCIHPFHECRATRDRAIEMEAVLNALRWRLGLTESATIQQIFAEAVSAIALNADNK